MQATGARIHISASHHQTYARVFFGFFLIDVTSFSCCPGVFFIFRGVALAPGGVERVVTITGTRPAVLVRYLIFLCNVL